MAKDSVRVLCVDLSGETFRVVERRDLARYFGGVGVATRLLAESVRPDLDPFHPLQPLVFAIGPMNSIFPVVTKTCLMFRSPLTGELGESYAGGRTAMAMRLAGYDALVVTGRAKGPSYLSIVSGRVRLKPADPLWGTTVEEAGRYLREMEPHRGFRSIIRIGPAGENMVRFASLNVDTFRHFGRLGAGAVFGSKNLKALYIYGDRDEPIPSDVYREYRDLYRELHERVLKTDAMEKYHDLGTPVNIMILNEMGALPTRNLQQSTFEFAEELSGEEFAEHSLVRQVACVGCPIGCIHLAMLRKRFGDLHEWESTVLPYDHEVIFALGTFLGLETREEFLELLDLVENLGMDAMTTGVLLGWATEAYARGLLNEADLGTRLQFGYVEGYKRAVRGIAEQKNDLYRSLARGTEYAASIYGGRDFALTLGGHEMTGYHTGYGAMIGQAVGARHSHLDNAGYAVDQRLRGQSIDPETMAEALYEEERARCLLNSLVICLFARKIYDFETVARCLKVLGYDVNQETLWQIADEIYYSKIELKERLGFRFDQIRVPHRFFETPTPYGYLDPELAKDIVNRFRCLVDEGKKRVNLSESE